MSDEILDKEESRLITDRNMKTFICLAAVMKSCDIDGDTICLQKHEFFVDINNDVIIDMNPEIPFGNRIYEWKQFTDKSPNNIPLLVAANSEEEARSLISEVWDDDDGCGILREVLKEYIGFGKNKFRFIE